MKPYPSYRPSGVEWLGDVPEGWGVKPLWSLFRRVKRTGFPEAELLSVYRDFGVIPKASRDDNHNNASEDLGAYQLVQVGDLAINKMKAWQGSVAISDFEGIVSPAYFIFTPSHNEDSRYLHYLMRSAEYTHAYLAHSKGVRPNQWDLEPQEHSRMGIILPSLPEQQAIAGFLDVEVGKIDALVAEQRRLIGLLAEKRQAVISHAVTRGLNPQPPLKPSGIDWLGDIPEGWEVVPLKHIASIGNGSTPSRDNLDYWTDGHFPWLNSSVVNLGEVCEAEQHVTSRALAECHLPIVNPPAVLVGLTGQGKTRGMSTILGVQATINQHLAFVRPNASTSCNFLRRVFEAAYEHIRADSEAGGTKGAITCEYLGNFRLGLPPFSMQQKIVEFLDEATNRFDTLTTTAQSAIDLLQERRAALISAAVTGKIDLRHLIPQTAKGS